MTQFIYSRQASGLVRAFRTRDVFVFNTLGFAVGLVASLMPSFLALQQPQAGIVATLSVGFGVCVLNGLLYAEISGVMPRSGGDYVFISRALSPIVGFCANWGLTWSQLFGIGAYAVWSVSTALAPGLVVLGRLNGLSSVEQLGISMSASPLATLSVAFSVLALCLAVSLAGVVVLRRVLLTGFVLAMAGTVVAGLGMFSVTTSEVRTALDNVLGSGGYNAILARFTADSDVVVTPTNWLSAFLALPVGYWAYLGFTYSVYIGGEVSQPKRAQFVGILGSLLTGYVMYVVLLGRYYDLFGRRAIAAFAHAESNAPELLPIPSTFMLNVGAAVGAGFTGWVAVLSFFLWYALLLLVMTQVCVRNIFAWSIDGITPSWLSQVSDKRAVPVNAVIVTLGLGVVFAVLVAFGLINFVNYVALFATCYLVTGIAAVSLPWRRPDLVVEPMGGFRRWRLVLLGVANTMVFAFVVFTALFSTDFSGVPATIWPTVFLVLVYGVGCVTFISAQRKIPVLERELRVSLPPE